MTTSPHADLIARLQDLKRQSIARGRTTASFFLDEEEQAAARTVFPESADVVYDGGYPGARKKRVIFRNAENDFSVDTVCLQAPVDQRFRAIGHRDILGALMSLQIDRHSFGDFWVEEGRCIFLYTSAAMGRFLKDQLTRIGPLSVQFDETDERPVQVFHTRRFEAVIASERADAIVACLAHLSRAEAQRMIRSGLVQKDHIALEKADELCNNGCTISIRGCGRFTYLGVLHRTRKDRIVAEFLQDL
jgi:RNA-binding protein YlmH